jgi:hypothetical protein
MWAGRILSGLVTAVLVFDGSIKVMGSAVVKATMPQLGYPDHVAFGLGPRRRRTVLPANF